MNKQVINDTKSKIEVGGQVIEKGHSTSLHSSFVVETVLQETCEKFECTVSDKDGKIVFSGGKDEKGKK